MKNTDQIIALLSDVRGKANGLIIEQLKLHGIIGLAPSHGAILVLLYKSRSRVCMKDIAETIGKDKSTITALVDKLVRMGYVRKTKSADDSRVTYLVLTEKGAEIKEPFFQISRTVLDRIYNGFDNNEKEQIVGYLERMSANL